jgi:hypothetical protein
LRQIAATLRTEGEIAVEEEFGIPRTIYQLLRSGGFRIDQIMARGAWEYVMERLTLAVPR